MNRFLDRFVMILLISVMVTACASTPPTPAPTESATPAASATLPPPTATSPPVSTPAAAATPEVELKPFPYTTPLPPPTPTELDGVYTRAVEFIGTPTPCRRCAPYRAEGGTWSIKFDKGVFQVWHDNTPFRGIGSFTVSGDQLFLFNDPNCHLEVGVYTWERDGRSLILRPVEDTCGFGLRAKNLADGSWLGQTDEEGRQIDACQPPSLEAAISGHWPAPPGC